PLYSEDLQLLPSPLLAGAELEPPAQSAPWLPASLHREGLTESLIDATGRPWAPAQPLPRGTRSLDLQNQCPFRAYAELRLGSTRRESVEPGIAPHRRGELLHAALQRLWERLRDSRSLGALSAAALDALIAASVERAAQAMLAGPAGRGRRQRALARLLGSPRRGGGGPRHRERERARGAFRRHRARAASAARGQARASGGCRGCLDRAAARLAGPPHGSDPRLSRRRGGRRPAPRSLRLLSRHRHLPHQRARGRRGSTRRRARGRRWMRP